MAKYRRLKVIDPGEGKDIGSLILDSDFLPEISESEPEEDYLYEFLEAIPHKDVKIWMRYSTDSAELFIRIQGVTLRLNAREIRRLKNAIDKAYRRRTKSASRISEKIRERCVKLSELLSKNPSAAPELYSKGLKVAKSEQSEEELQ